MNDKFFAKDFNVFKVPQNGGGSALALSFTNIGLLLKIAKQNPNSRSFDWKNATLFSLSITDIAAIVNGLNNRTEVKLFHDAAKFAGAKNPVQKGLNIAFNDQYKNFYFSLWRKSGNDTITVGIPVSNEEALAIRVLMQWALPRILQWDLVELKADNVTQYHAELEDTQTIESNQGLPEGMSDDPFWAGAEVVEPNQAPQLQTNEGLKDQILAIVRAKYNINDEQTAIVKVMELTNMPFTPAYYLEIMKAVK